MLCVVGRCRETQRSGGDINDEKMSVVYPPPSCVCRRRCRKQHREVRIFMAQHSYMRI